MPSLIDDGKWLAYAGETWEKGAKLHGYAIIGVDEVIVQQECVGGGLNSVGQEERDYKLLAPEPFATIATAEPLWGKGCFKRLSLARQIVKGEPTRELRVKHPSFVRGARRWRWCTLTDLASCLNLDIERLWNFYHPIQDIEWQGKYFDFDAKGRVILTIAVDDPLAEVSIRSFGTNRAGSLSLERIWVPAGWAMNVCRLSALGYVP